jgi:hypothetical protein
MIMRYVKSKLTGEIRKQYSRFDGLSYVFLPLNAFWEVTEEVTEDE